VDDEVDDRADAGEEARQAPQLAVGARDLDEVVLPDAQLLVATDPVERQRRVHAGLRRRTDLRESCCDRAVLARPHEAGLRRVRADLDAVELVLEPLVAASGRDLARVGVGRRFAQPRDHRARRDLGDVVELRAHLSPTEARERHLPGGLLAHRGVRAAECRLEQLGPLVGAHGALEDV
jgi:hypothetical protein